MSWLGRIGSIDPYRKIRPELERVRSEAGALAAERDAYIQQRDQALGERNEWRRQRDVAMAERDAYLQQRDDAIGAKNLQANRLARHIHRVQRDGAPRHFASTALFGAAAATRDRLLLFLHLAKTGGVTLSDIFARNFGIEEFLQVEMTDGSVLGTWSHVNVERALAKMTDNEVDQVRAVWGHFRQGIQRHLPKPCACITVLRDPVDRVISAFCYEVQCGVMTNPDGSVPTLDDYVSRKRSYDLYIDNYMTRVLSGLPDLDPTQEGATTEYCARPTDADFELAANNLDSYMVVGLTDQFDDTLLVLAADLCWSLSDMVYTPLNATASRPTAADVAEFVRNEIMNWN